MQLDDPFPVEEFPRRSREAILAEFRGRRPSVREVVSIPDTRWLGAPDIGPGTLAKLRRLTRGMRRKLQIPSLAELTEAKLVAERDFLDGELKRLLDEVNRVRDRLKANRAELRLRGIASRTSAKVNRSRVVSTER
jgi:hypothetical protein